MSGAALSLWRISEADEFPEKNPFGARIRALEDARGNAKSPPEVASLGRSPSAVASHSVL